MHPLDQFFHLQKPPATNQSSVVALPVAVLSSACMYLQALAMIILPSLYFFLDRDVRSRVKDYL